MTKISSSRGVPRRDMPDELAAKLRAARARRQMWGERRVITMLFCDVTGSTAMAEHLDPEEWAEIMNEAYDYLIAPIYRYEGTLARLMGDGFLAFFGAPIAHENDPQRAVLAGLDIIDELEPFCHEMREEYGLDFNVRVGINTGPVVVGDIGSDLALEYTAMGDAINLASRMEETAAPGTVQVSFDTYKLVAPLFEVEELGPQEIKGKAEPVSTYRVIRRKEQPGRLRGIEGLETSIVGRQAELEALKKILVNLDQGKGHIIFLIGEAGLGKSRLIAELRQFWIDRHDDPMWTESSSVPYEVNRPYGSIYSRMLLTAGVSEQDTPEMAREKVMERLADYPAEHRSAVSQAVLTLLAVEQEADEPQLEAEALKRELFAATKRVWRQEARLRPTVSVFDDIHWADSASVELLADLLPLVREVPVLIICAARPYRDSYGWQLKETAESEHPGFYSEFNLRPLSDSDSQQMIDQLLVISELPGQLRRLILRKAEGNPFFVEEVIRSLIDKGAIVRDKTGLRWRAAAEVEAIDIPDTIQGLLMSRIDRLERETKRTLQLASVIGRAFFQRLLGEIADRIDNLTSQLDILQASELILETARVPEVEYMFRHELTRDAAYETILHRQRRLYHRRVAEAIESLYADRLNEQANRLAYHYDAAGNREKALDYYTIAGDNAAQLYANEEAITHYRRAKELAVAMGDPEHIIGLYMRAGRTMEVSGRYQEAVDNYKELAELGRERPDPAMEISALNAQATIHATYTVVFNPDLGFELAEKALELAQRHGERVAEAKTYWNLMLLETYGSADFEKALDYGTRSLAIARDHDLKEQIAYTLQDLIRPYALSGKFDLALELALEAQSFFRELGNLPMLADNLATTATGYIYFGDLEKAIEFADQALQISRSIGSQWGEAYTLTATAPAQLCMGLFDETLDALETGMTLARQAGFLGPLIYAQGQRAQTYYYLGAYQRALDASKQSLETITSVGQDVDQIYALTSISMVHMRRGELDLAAQILDELSDESYSFQKDFLAEIQLKVLGAELLLSRGDYARIIEVGAALEREFIDKRMCLFIPRIRFFVGKALIALDRVEEAREILSAGLSVASDSKIRLDQYQILVTLMALEESAGQVDRATHYEEEAKKIVRFMIDHISDSELLASFKQIPEVRVLL